MSDRHVDGGKRHLRSMLSDSAYVVGGSYATQLFSLFIVMVLSRRLSVETYGVYGVILAAYAFGTMALSLGFQPVIQRYLPELLAKGDRRKTLRLQWIGGLGHLAASAIIILITLIFRTPLAVWTEQRGVDPEQFRELLPYFALFTVFKFEASVLEEILSAHRSQLFRNLILASFQGLKFALFWFFLPHEGAIETVLSFLVLSNLLLMLAFLVRVLGLSRRVPDGGCADLVKNRVIRFGLLRYINRATYAGLWSTIDIGFVSHFKGFEAAGLYTFAAQIITHVVHLVPTSNLYTVLVPVYVRAYTLNKDENQLIKVFRFYNKVVTLCLAPVFVGAFMMIGPITAEFFDLRFLPAVTTFRILIAGMFIWHFMNTSGFLLVVLEKPEISLYSRVFVIYNIIMLRILIPEYGILGAAVATSTTNAFTNTMAYLLLKRKIAIRIPWAATARTFVYTGVMVLVVWPFLPWIDNIAKLLLVVGLGAAVYISLAWRLPVFDQDEKRKLNDALGRRIFRL